MPQRHVASLQNLTAFADLDSRLSNKLDKMEKSVIASKRGKMARDKNDYESNNVYTWEKNTVCLQSITEKPWQTSQFLGSGERSADNTLARTMSDSSPDRSTGSVETTRSNGHSNAGNPRRSGHTKKKKSSIKKTRRGGSRYKNSKQHTLQPTRQNEKMSFSILNISKRPLKEEEISLLSKGPNFCPNRHFDLFNTILDVNRFFPFLNT